MCTVSNRRLRIILVSGLEPGECTSTDQDPATVTERIGNGLQSRFRYLGTHAGSNPAGGLGDLDVSFGDPCAPDPPIKRRAVEKPGLSRRAHNAEIVGSNPTGAI